MSVKRLSVVVVGGGIGGLFAANALISRGLQVSVHEQAAGLGEVGAGVFLTPNSVRQLQRVGLGPSIEKRGAKVGFGSYYFRCGWNPLRTSATRRPTVSPGVSRIRRLPRRDRA